MTPQTQSERREAAEKGVATRKRREAARKRSTQRAVKTRAEAEAHGLKALWIRGERIFDATGGRLLRAAKRASGR